MFIITKIKQITVIKAFVYTKHIDNYKILRLKEMLILLDDLFERNCVLYF